MNKLSTLLLASAMIMPVQAFAQDGSQHQKGWSYTVSAGAVYSPNYLGDDEGQISAFPSLRVTYEDKFFASLGQGIGYNVINSNGFKAGPIVKYDFGRDEDGSSPFGWGDGTDDLIGLGDVDGSVEIGAYAEYKYRPVTAKIKLRQGMGGHEGLVGEASIHYGGNVNIVGQQVLYSIGPELSYTDGDYNDAYFSVDPAQSVASGLAQYDGDDATVSYGIGGNIIIPHTKRISTLLFADYTQLGDTIADSSLVETRGSDNQFTAGILLNYTF
jgi:outer membrane scaffolding protein for murein synthesis (MipA/OmpV family)